LIASFKTTVGDVARAVKGTILFGDGARAIETISSDSRELETKNLFVPIVGGNFDGHDFIEILARDRKIDCFLTSRPEDERIARDSGVAAILCGNTLYALGAIALEHRRKFPLPVIGITGTNGKTTTKELAACALSAQGRVMKSEKNYNNEIGVPFTLMGLSDQFDFAVIEMGMNHAGEISRLTQMVRPSIAVITNAGEGHLEFLGSVENVARAKSEIMESMKPGSVIILNEESECFDVMRSSAEKRKLTIKTVGIKVGTIRPESYRLFPAKTEVAYKNILFSVPLYGIHNVYNIMSAIAVAEECGADLAQVAGAFSFFENVGKRSDLVERDFVLVNDTYNSNPLSLTSALRSLAEIYPTKRKIAVLSDMKELGEHSERCHRNAGSDVTRFGFSLLYTWGEMSRWISEGAIEAGLSRDCVFHFSSKEELSRSLRSTKLKGDVILVKGSRSMKMEEVADAILTR
jgi:UDP-N-acetylmuramoyl-tripeptide--D-alanyl-D-alanine ligase